MDKLQTKTKKVLIAFLVLTALFLLNLDKINPSYPIFYPLKRFLEKIYLTLKFSPSAKLEYSQVLLDYRLKELESLAGSNQGGQMASASLRYSTTAGDLVNLIKENNLEDQVGPILDQFKEHKTRIKSAHDKMMLKLGVVPTLDQRKQLQTSMDALDIYSQTLSSVK